MQRAGTAATLRCSAWASHRGGFSWCRAQALGTWASVVLAMDLVALQHVESYQTQDGTLSPALAGRLLTTRLPGKPFKTCFTILKNNDLIIILK